jgi:hypothetical protein
MAYVYLNGAFRPMEDTKMELMPWINPRLALEAAIWDRDDARQRGDVVREATAKVWIAKYQAALAA